LKEADRAAKGADAQRAAESKARWRAAHDMAELKKYGETQALIADHLDVSQSTVSDYLRVHSEFYHARGKTHFSDALKEVRGGTWGHTPVTTTKRAEIAADYLQDRDVWKAPEVRKAIDRNVRKDIREESRPNRPSLNGGTKVTVISGGIWHKLRAQMVNCEEAIKESLREMKRSGMPNTQAGALIKQARRLAAAADRLEEWLSTTAIGKAG
jgi:hypothetical protein